MLKYEREIEEILGGLESPENRVEDRPELHGTELPQITTSSAATVLRRIATPFRLLTRIGAVAGVALILLALIGSPDTIRLTIAVLGALLFTAASAGLLDCNREGKEQESGSDPMLRP